MLLSLALGACLDTTPPEPTAPAQGIIVLHGFGALPGVVQTDSMVAGSRLVFPAEFDGGSMRVQRDTVLTTSSGWRGDNRLYLVDLRARTVHPVEMPARANSAGATLTSGFRGSRAAVAFRGREAVGLVTMGATGTEVAELADVGRCPYDVAMHAGSLWVVDHNAACESDYEAQGDSRLIRVAAGADRDTLDLPGVKHATSIRVIGNLAWVASIGVTTYAPDFTPTFESPGSITVVDLAGPRVLGTLALPQGTSGASMQLGLDGYLYVTAFLNTAYETGVFRIDPATLEFTGIRVPGAQHLRLLNAAGEPVQCAAATADRFGRVYCVVNQGAGASTFMVALTAAGNEIRRFATGGTGAVDISMR